MKFALKIAVLILIITAFSKGARAQKEPQKPAYEKEVVEKDGKYYIQKTLPIYLKFSTAPDGKEYPLKSAEHPSDANPIYFDKEGVNYIRTKWAVDPITRKPVTPQREVMMEMYADGVAPTTSLRLDVAPRYVNGGITYFGKGLNFSLSARDEVSGVLETRYALNGPYTKYANTVTAIGEGVNTLYYYSADNVGNVENTKSNTFTVDLTPPTLSHSIVGIVYNNNIIAPSTAFKLNAYDNLSGINGVFYSFNKGNDEYYTPNINVNQLPDGEHTLYYYAIDNVRNESEKMSFDFYLDKIAPTVNYKIIGDQFDKSTYMYVSPRTRLNLSAYDNKAGVKQIYFRMDGKDALDFSSDFNFPNKLGTHTLEYNASDNVGNTSEVKYLTVFTDDKAPETGIFYGAPQFFIKDTLFITSQTPVTLKPVDGQSGVKATNYGIDGEEMKTYEKFTVFGNGPHKINFNATDNVNNEEDIKTSVAFVDNIPPEIFLNFSIEPIGRKGNLNVYPNFVRVYIGATDKHVGTERVLYSIDGGPLVDYSSPQTLDISEMSQFKDKKKYKLRVVSEDKLGNRSERTFEFYVGRNGD